MSHGFSGNRPGFTLFEILMVCVLMGILFSISFTSFGNARDRSCNSQVDGNIRVLQQALVTYEADNEKFPTSLVRVTNGSIGTVNPTDLVLLDPVLDRRYLPANLMPRTPWTECWQGNNIIPPRLEAAAGLWRITDPEIVTNTVKVPANPTNIDNNGKLPTDGGTPRAVQFTSSVFGAVLYQTNGPTARDRYVLIGVGKARRGARVVAIATNAN